MLIGRPGRSASRQPGPAADEIFENF